MLPHFDLKSKAMAKFWARKATQYIFSEMIPSLVIGVLVFISILLMTQALRLTDFVLIHGVSIGVVFKMMGYMAISFLPALLPMALLFSVIMTYNRFSQDSEIVAFKSSGMSMWTIAWPAFLLSALVAFMSAQTSFQLAPWGNRQFEVLISRVSQSKAGITLREGTFSEGFFDLVVYANKVDSSTGMLEKVFIYDERNEDSPLTIIARNGQLVQNPDRPGQQILLRLENGDIHRKGESHTKIRFEKFDIKLWDQVSYSVREKSAQSMSLEEVSENIQRLKTLEQNKKNIKDFRLYLSEYHKRWALAVVCLIFGALGVALGTVTNKRSQKSSGFVLSLIVIILYWIIYVSLEGAARNGTVPVVLALWTPNILFLGFALYRLKKIWH
jgi:lipopolysaccharide export system permease protein